MSRLPGKAIATLASVVGIPVAAALLVAIPEEESGRKVNVTMTANGRARVAHVSGKQYLKAYLDVAGVATACDGLTRDEFGRPIRLGMKFTEAQCEILLERALVAHAQGVMACTPGLALSVWPSVERMRQGPRFAAVSLAYNVGVRRYCSSTARQRFNAERYPAGCEAITWFNRAGGRVVTGLVKRRGRERKICIGGLQ